MVRIWNIFSVKKLHHQVLHVNIDGFGWEMGEAHILMLEQVIVRLITRRQCQEMLSLQGHKVVRIYPSQGTGLLCYLKQYFALLLFFFSWENFVSVPSILCFCQCLIVMKGQHLAHFVFNHLPASMTESPNTHVIKRSVLQNDC